MSKNLLIHNYYESIWKRNNNNLKDLCNVLYEVRMGITKDLKLCFINRSISISIDLDRSWFWTLHRVMSTSVCARRLIALEDISFRLHLCRIAWISFHCLVRFQSPWWIGSTYLRLINVFIGRKIHENKRKCATL